MLDVERIDDIRHKDHLRIYYLSGEILDLLISIKSIFIEKYSCCLIRSSFMRQSNIQHTVSIDKQKRLFPFQQNVNKSRL